MTDTTVLPLKQALAERRYFKLICGAGYRNFEVIRWLTRVYTHAGAHAIDVGLDVDAVRAAVAGIREAQAEGATADPVVMVSLDAGGDVHFYRIALARDNCTDCSACIPTCRFGALAMADQLELIEPNCLGCRECLPACPTDALSLLPWGDSLDYAGLLDACWEAGARAIEVHTGSGADDGAHALWRLIEPQRERWPLISFSIGDYGQGLPAVLRLAGRICDWARSDIMIQADGKPISGRAGEASTLPALRLAAELAALDLPAYVQVSGGTNDLTGSLAKAQGIPIHGVAMGSFARAYLGLEEAPDLSRQDLWQSIQRARELVLSVNP